ncbi:MAG: histidine phosphatase family protein, partial [Mesorhizobium sp.]
MRQLLILRHGKSSWDDPKLEDFDRPLGPRGLKTAPLMGRELSRRGWLPDLALVSPALRTRDSWRLVSQELPKHVPAEFAEELYEAAPGAILARVRRAKATSLIVIGHNPGLQNFALQLAGAGSDAGVFRK